MHLPRLQGCGRPRSDRGPSATDRIRTIGLPKQPLGVTATSAPRTALVRPAWSGKTTFGSLRDRHELRWLAPWSDRICMHLDGITLALELAAARVRAVPVHVAADRLVQRVRLLTRGDRTAVPRQPTLAATVESSNDLLTDNQRRLFRITPFRGGWTRSPASSVCGRMTAAAGKHSTSSCSPWASRWL